MGSLAPGIELVFLGVDHVDLSPEVLIGSVDIVVGKGRDGHRGDMGPAQARPICYDSFGGDGWITPDTYAALESDGHTGQAGARGLDLDRLGRRRHTTRSGSAWSGCGSCSATTTPRGTRTAWSRCARGWARATGARRHWEPECDGRRARWAPEARRLLGLRAPECGGWMPAPSSPPPAERMPRRVVAEKELARVSVELDAVSAELEKVRARVEELTQRNRRLRRRLRRFEPGADAPDD